MLLLFRTYLLPEKETQNRPIVFAFQILPALLCADERRVIMPMIISKGRAIWISPPTTIPIRIKGRKTIVNKIFTIPQAAFTAKIRSLPNILIIKIVNNSVNISFTPCLLLFVCS